MSTTHRSLPRPLAPVALACLALLGVLTSPAHAQVDTPDATAESVNAPGPKPSVWIEPRVSAGVTVSNNGNLSNGGRSEQTLDISPGVRVVADTPRVRGFLDYSLHSLSYLQDTSGDELRHALQAQAVLNAWDQRAFLELSGAIDDQARSALGTPLGSSLADVNRTQTTRFRVSPYLRGRLPGDIDTELRYAWQSANADAADRSDITDQQVSLRLNSNMTGQTLGWTATLLSQDTDYSLARRTRSDSAQAGLVVQPTPQLRFTASVGRERNDILTLQTESYSYNGVSVDWRPSPRTRALVAVDDRYFGTGHNILLEHRTGLTVWRYTDTRSANNDPLQQGTASLGSVYDLLDNLYSGLEPDPIRRAQLIQAELLRLGLPADAQLLQNFLASSNTLQRRQELSLALVGTRSVLTFALGRSRTERLGTFVGLGDDFDQFTSIAQRSWSVRLGHRLTQLTALSAGLTRQVNESNLAGFDTRLTEISVGLTTRLAERTSGTLTLRRTRSDGGFGAYNDTSVAGYVTHRF